MSRERGPRGAAGLRRTIPALPVRDVPAAVGWYRERLGFDASHVEDGFAIVARDGAELHLWRAGDEAWRAREDLAQRPIVSGAESFVAGTSSCRIECADVDALFAELRDAGALHPRVDAVVATPFGTREATALDGDGNALTFFGVAGP